MQAANTIGAGEPFPLDCEEELPMRILRHIGAAYETGDAQCWEAAYARAEAERGTIAGALLVSRATAVLRVVRVDRPDFVFLPTPCRTLSGDEAALLTLLRTARISPPPLAAARRILDDVGAIGLLAMAACALMETDIAPIGIGTLYAAHGRHVLHVVG